MTKMYGNINNGNGFKYRSVHQFYRFITDTRLQQLTDCYISKMKVIALILCIAALARARVNYRLKCTSAEIGIRWPSYHSNSEYYMCQSVGGTQLTAQCNSGEVFTFVLQQCTVPSMFIPPPPLDILPTSAPITITYGNEPNQNYPKPEHVDTPAEHSNGPFVLPQLTNESGENEDFPGPPTPPQLGTPTTTTQAPGTPPTPPTPPNTPPTPPVKQSKPKPQPKPQAPKTAKKPTIPKPGNLQKAVTPKKPSHSPTKQPKA